MAKDTKTNLPEHLCKKEDEFKKLNTQYEALKKQAENTFTQFEALREHMQNVFYKMLELNVDMLKSSKSDDKENRNQNTIDSKFNSALLIKILIILAVLAGIGLGTGLFLLVLTNFDVFVSILKLSVGKGS